MTLIPFEYSRYSINGLMGWRLSSLLRRNKTCDGVIRTDIPHRIVSRIRLLHRAFKFKVILDVLQSLFFGI